jgi:transposase-like protein
MPWRHASPMDQRTQVIADHLRDAWPITELCEHYGVSRKTGYKWIDRYLREALDQQTPASCYVPSPRELPPSGPPWNIPIASKCATSAPMAVSGGTADG